VARPSRRKRYVLGAGLPGDDPDFVFKNTFADLEYIVKELWQGHGTRFEFECYDLGHLYNLAWLIDQGWLEPPYLVQMVFGVLGGVGADLDTLVHMHTIAEKLFGEDYEWSVLAAGHQMPFATQAAMLGGNLRVGMEDSLFFGPGELATSSARADDPPGDDNGGSRDDNGGSRDGRKNEQRVAGSCTGGSTAKLKVKHDDGRIETEFEVDQNRNGVQWTVRIRRDGKRVVKTHATTTAPSGSFSVERKIADPAGSNRITGKATSPSGEVCTASATI